MKGIGAGEKTFEESFFSRPEPHPLFQTFLINAFYFCWLKNKKRSFPQVFKKGLPVSKRNGRQRHGTPQCLRQRVKGGDIALMSVRVRKGPFSEIAGSPPLFFVCFDTQFNVFFQIVVKELQIVHVVDTFAEGTGVIFARLGRCDHQSA